MKQIVLFPTGTLEPKLTKRFARAGVLAVEVPDPTKVVTLLPVTPVLNGDIVLQAAFHAIKSARIDQAAGIFGAELIRLLSNGKAVAK